MAFELATAKALRAPLRTFNPNVQQQKYISDGKAFMVMKAAFWAHYLYNEMRIEFTDQVPIAATDSYTIFVNPAGMLAAKMDFAEVCFVLAHEICHKMFGDLIMAVRWRELGYVVTSVGNLPYDHGLMNAAEDYRINALLIKAKVGKMPSIGLFDPSLSAEGMEPAVEIYAKLYQQGKRGGDYGMEPGGKGRGTPGNLGKGGFDVHLEPSQKAKDDEATGQSKQGLVAAQQAAQAAGQGNLPAALGALIGEILEPHVPWQELLKSTMLRKSGDPTFDWRYLDKRLLVRPDPMYFARQAHMGAGCVVIGYDSSGSCVNDRYQRRFFSEMAGIVADLNPSELIVIWCDAAVQRVDEIEEPEDLEELRADINRKGGAPGGGGTDFRPVFQEIEERGLQPDMVVYLTDTYGSFPEHEPDYPVIWCSVVKSPRVPWGDVVEVEL